MPQNKRKYIRRFGINHDFTSGYISAKPSMYRQSQSLITPVDNTRVTKKYNRPAVKYRPIQSRSLTQTRDVIKGNGKIFPKENTVDSKLSKFKESIKKAESNNRDRKLYNKARKYLNDYYSAPTISNFVNIIKDNSIPFDPNAGLITGTPPLPGTMKAPIVDGIYKRAIETAMRTTPNPNPVPTIKENWKLFIDKDRKKEIIKRILFNKKRIPGYNDTFDSGSSYYRGFLGNNGIDKIDGPDVIDAVLYGKTIDPRFGLRLTEDKNFGNLKKYIEDNYKLKKDKIKIYNITSNPKAVGGIEYDPKFIRTGSASIDEDPLDDLAFYLRPGLKYDAGGYNYIRGTYNGEPYGYGEDIYKFNPKDYSTRYGQKSLLTRLGLGIVDHYTTPIIVRGIMRKMSPTVKKAISNSSKYSKIIDNDSKLKLKNYLKKLDINKLINKDIDEWD